VGATSVLAGFEPYWVARADLCAKLGEVDAARGAYGLAIGLQTDPAARAFLIERLAALAWSATSAPLARRSPARPTLRQFQPNLETSDRPVPTASLPRS
jgi:hypothetical protein